MEHRADGLANDRSHPTRARFRHHGARRRCVPWRVGLRLLTPAHLASHSLGLVHAQLTSSALPACSSPGLPITSYRGFLDDRCAGRVSPRFRSGYWPGASARPPSRGRGASKRAALGDVIWSHRAPSPSVFVLLGLIVSRHAHYSAIRVRPSPPCRSFYNQEVTATATGWSLRKSGKAARLRRCRHALDLNDSPFSALRKLETPRCRPRSGGSGWTLRRLRSRCSRSRTFDHLSRYREGRAEYRRHQPACDKHHQDRSGLRVESRFRQSSTNCGLGRLIEIELDRLNACRIQPNLYVRPETVEAMVGSGGGTACATGTSSSAATTSVNLATPSGFSGMALVGSTNAGVMRSSASPS